jgi:hypothetical protein
MGARQPSAGDPTVAFSRTIVLEDVISAITEVNNENLHGEWVADA